MAALEAMLFASPGAVRISELIEATGWKPAQVDKDLEALEESLRVRGIELQRVAGAVRLMTSAPTAPFVERLIGVQSRRRLTRAQLETLAVVAYRQPATRAQAESLRGVSCERVLAQLCDLRLIREVGRAELPGRPLLYGTTADFLRYFGLNSLEQLPDIFQLKRTMPAEGVSASQASWNAAARGETENPEGFESVDVSQAVAPQVATPTPNRMGTMVPIAAELAGGPSAGLQKLFDKIRGKRPVQQASPRGD
jgi:segregation and condensation protein B